MEIAIYNGFLSDSNEFILIDTKEISLKKAITIIQNYIDEIINKTEYQDDEKKDLKDFYLIGEHEIWIEKTKHENVSNYKMIHTGWGYSYIRAK